MDEKDKIKWWQLSKDKLFSTLSSTSDGLSLIETKNRLEKYGPNVVAGRENKSAFSILLYQFKNWLILMLLGASLISFFLGEHLEGMVIIALVLLSVLFGFYQEYKAEKAIAELKKFLTYKSRVKREGDWMEIDSKTIVPGDIVEVRIGDKISADMRLLEVDGFVCDESVLTGESFPNEKTSETISTDSHSPTNLKNMVFMGTTVAGGKGVGIVIATGKNTELGKTAKSLEEPEPDTDFQKQIRNFSLFLFRVVMIMTLFIFTVNAVLKKEIFDSLLFALALAVGVTPEMLPAIISVTLSAGAMKMAKKKVVVKRLIAVEDFGNVDTLCMDKTGTLTEGKFSLDNFINFDEEIDETVLSNACVCVSGSHLKNHSLFTNPIDSAIVNSGFAQSIKDKLGKIKIIDENEFDYKRKRMSVVVKKGSSCTLIAKGAFESVLSISDTVIIGGKKVPITNSVNKRILAIIQKYEEKNYRLIAIASKNAKEVRSTKNDEHGLTLNGLLLFRDPVKATAREAVERFNNLGVDLKVLSGDSLSITVSVAREAGVVFLPDEVVDGDSLNSLSDSEFAEIAKSAKIFARVTPDQKYKIVRALNYEGHIVGFLGDGVNDAPALRASDVGISVDTGADIAKDASDIILLEKDLKILSEGIEAGRKTFGNIMKYILNTISANYGNMFTVAVSSLFLKFIPLLPSQILLNNFISDIPLFAVATDNVDAHFVKKPKKWNLGFIKNFMLYYGFVSSAFDLLLILPMIFILHVPPEVFRTAWFVESSISEILVTFAIRTRLPFYKSRPGKWLIWLSVGSILVVLAMPIFGVSAFQFVALPTSVWILILIDLIAYFAVTEIVKHKFFVKFESKE